MKTEVVKVIEAGVAAAAKRGAEVLCAGKLVGFATETVYGLAAMATDQSALQRLRELKSRPKTPFSVHLGRASDVGRYVSSIPTVAGRLINKVWPGPLTLLLPTGGTLADRKFQKAGLHDILCYEDTIGLRCPRADLALQMLSSVDAPVVAPSANPVGHPSPRDADAVLECFDGKIDLLIDSGSTELGLDSTIVKFDSNGWNTVRIGAIDEQTIEWLALRRILFVCTGNTCRSPMAEGIARKMLAAGTAVGPDRLAEAGWDVCSAGLWAADGQPATPEAVNAAGTSGVDIAGHRSQKLTPELIKSADLVLCMTDFHVTATRQVAEGSSVEIYRLDEQGDIPDPIGGGMGVYRRTAERLAELLRERLDKGML